MPTEPPVQHSPAGLINPGIWKTEFARARPIVTTVDMDAPFGWWQTLQAARRGASLTMPASPAGERETTVAWDTIQAAPSKRFQHSTRWLCSRLDFDGSVMLLRNLRRAVRLAQERGNLSPQKA
jgi:hypothetical protein